MFRVALCRNQFVPKLIARHHGLSTTTLIPVSKPNSILPRVILFSIVSLSLSAGSIAYVLVTNETRLIWAHETFPRFTNFIAPYLGLPQEHATSLSANDEEEEHEQDIKKVVGDTVYVCFKLSSGRAIILECGSDETSKQLHQRASLELQPGDRVMDFTLLETNRALELMSKSSEDLAREMNHVPIPEIPEVINVHTCEVGIELCRQTELDLQVRLKLARNEYDKQNLMLALGNLEARKQELKLLLKQERAKLGVQSIFRRGR